MARATTLLPGGTAGRLFGTGLALGVAAGTAWATWAAGRALGGQVSRDRTDNPRLINWGWARAIATKTARAYGPPPGAARPAGSAEAREAARAEYVRLVERSAARVSEYTGIRLPAPLTQVHLFDRVEWVDANLSQFQLMFEPLDAAYAAALARAAGAAPVGALGQVLLSAQMGILLGYLARRVLGQYDLALLGREPVPKGRLYFVGPNLAAMEERYALPPQQFRAWIALHEVTHAVEFEAHPWVRDYMNELLTVYLRSLSDDLFGQRAGGALGTFAGRIKDNLFESSHMLELMMSREQRAVFRKLQALMALMEGYSNHVMQQVGARHLKDHQTLKQTFESRARSRSPAEQLFIKLTGLDIKLEQYALGERFCQQVVEARGIDFMNRVWAGPEQLPALDEIHEPGRWIARQAAAVA
jgi:coenzyme F420 biosynthesis associated uncharacterized protein